MEEDGKKDKIMRTSSQTPSVGEEAEQEKEFARSCFDGKIAFTHFVGVRDYPATQHFSTAYERSVALACDLYSEAFDGLIPVKHDNKAYENIAVKVKITTCEINSKQDPLSFTPISSSGNNSVGLIIHLRAKYQPPFFIHNTLVLCGLSSFEHLAPYPEWLSHLQNTLVDFADPFACTENDNQRASLERILGMGYE